MHTREFQLLLYCATSQPHAGRIKDVVQEGIRWQALVKLGQQHGIRPILHQTLKSVCWDFVPQPIQRELEHLYRTNVQTSLLFGGELLRLLSAFQQNGIPLAALKGAVLAELLYGDLALREFSDLDIIVQEADMSKAEDILTAWGYQADFPDRDFRSAFLSYQGQYAFRNQQTGLVVDLHWRLSSKGEAFPLKSEEIWPRLGQVTISGRTVPTLALDDLALFLAAHGTKEGWRLLKWICDFAELLRKCEDVDWTAVLDRAERANSSRPLLLAVALASTLLDAPTPPVLIAKARNNAAIRALADKAQLRMLRTAPGGELRAFLDGLKTHDRMRHRLWPIGALLTTRTVGDHRAMPLPKSLWRLYYVTRPFRLATKAMTLLQN